MDRTFSRNFDARESSCKTLSDFTGTPARVLLLHMENIVLYLKRQLVRIVMGSSAAVGQSLHPTFLVAIEDLVTGFAGDAELPAQFRHRLARDPATHKLNSFVHNRTFLPRHSLPPLFKKGKKCNPCLRYELSPMSQVGHQGPTRKHRLHNVPTTWWTAPMSQVGHNKLAS